MCLKQNTTTEATLVGMDEVMAFLACMRVCAKDSCPVES